MRHSILKPIPELEIAATRLDAPATAIVSGERELAAELVKKANIPEIMVYAIRAVGPLSAEPSEMLA